MNETQDVAHQGNVPGLRAGSGGTPPPTRNSLGVEDWVTSDADPFEVELGPYRHRYGSDGAAECTFTVGRKHLNADGFVHGGALMAFADHCLYVIARPHLRESCVTVSLTCEFIGASTEGDVISGRGETIRVGGALVFVRGLLECDDRTILSFNAVLKQVSAVG